MSERLGRMTSYKTFATRPEQKRSGTLISAYSYEDRIVDSLRRSIEAFGIRKAIMLAYDGEAYLDEATLEKRHKHKEKMRQVLENSDVVLKEVSCRHDDVTRMTKNLEEEVSASEGNLVVDITGLTKNYILRLAKFLEPRTAAYFYTRSKKERVPTREELAVSVNRVEPIPGYEGYIDINKRDLIVLILGYEGNRSLAFLRKFETEPIFAIVGSPYAKDEKTNRLYVESAEMANTKLLNVHRVFQYEEYVHSLDPFAFAQDLEIAISSYTGIEGFNVCLSCLGTKLQTLGLFLYWKRKPEHQIVYSVPNRRFDISSGVGESFVIEPPSSMPTHTPLRS